MIKINRIQIRRPIKIESEQKRKELKKELAEFLGIDKVYVVMNFTDYEETTIKPAEKVSELQKIQQMQIPNVLPRNGNSNLS